MAVGIPMRARRSSPSCSRMNRTSRKRTRGATLSSHQTVTSNRNSRGRFACRWLRARDLNRRLGNTKPKGFKVAFEFPVIANVRAATIEPGFDPRRSRHGAAILALPWTCLASFRVLVPAGPVRIRGHGRRRHPSSGQSPSRHTRPRGSIGSVFSETFARQPLGTANAPRLAIPQSHVAG
jgi:hypothetical protein